MPQLYTDLDKFLRIRPGDALPVRVLTLIPDRALVHFLRPEGRGWLYWGCDHTEDCRGCQEEVVRPVLRWRYDFSTEEGTKEMWTPAGLHRDIEEHQVRLGNDLFLMTDFVISRDVPPVPQYHIRLASSETI